jgi:hypothetical protein
LNENWGVLNVEHLFVGGGFFKIEFFPAGELFVVEEHLMALCLQGQSDFFGLGAVFRGIGIIYCPYLL